MDSKVRHLEFIQGVINRHNSNSFRIKGWAITLASAIFALTGTIREPYLCFVALGPIIMFWILDSMFLANERCFVSLYSCVAKGNKLSVPKSQLKKKIREELEINQDVKTCSKEYKVAEFSMHFIQFREIKKNNWQSVCFSYTIRWFYLALVILTFCFWGLVSMNKCKTASPLSINANVTTAKINPIDVNAKIISMDTLTKSVAPAQDKKQKKNQ